MALKFLNKKGWHTGSLRNIENVWKAEQKHDAEQKKLDELRKQIQEERERSEFRQLQEQAGILPRQERLEFLYDSGLAVGKGNSEGVLFKSLDKADAPSESAPSSSAATSASAAPGALFEDKTYSANDAWRKLHSDPLLLIRRREQDALARIKNNPVQMAMIRKSVGEKSKEKDRDKRERRKKHHHKDSSKDRKRASSEPSDSDDASKKEEKERKQRVSKGRNNDTHKKRVRSASGDESSDRETTGKKDWGEDSKYKERSPDDIQDRKSGRHDQRDPYGRSHERSHRENYYSERPSISDAVDRERERSHRENYYSERPSISDAVDRERERERERVRERERERARERKMEKEKEREREKERGWERDREMENNYSSEGGKSKYDSRADFGHERSHQENFYLEHPSISDASEGGRGRGRERERAEERGRETERERGRGRERENNHSSEGGKAKYDSRADVGQEPNYKRRNAVPKLSEEERAARLREMQADAELHEEQRWKRLKKADDDAAREAKQDAMPGGKNFLDATHRSVYGAEKCGSSTIEESVRRRKYYSQGRSEAGEGNAFRR